MLVKHAQPDPLAHCQFMTDLPPCVVRNETTHHAIRQQLDYQQEKHRRGNNSGSQPPLMPTPKPLRHHFCKPLNVTVVACMPSTTLRAVARASAPVGNLGCHTRRAYCPAGTLSSRTWPDADDVPK